MVKGLASFSSLKKVQNFQDNEKITKVSFLLRFGGPLSYFTLGFTEHQ